MGLIGHVTLDLRPGENNPRNSEGAFINLSDGRIMFIYSRFTGNSSNDDAYANLARRYSTDFGVTWTDEETIITGKEEDSLNIMSVSLMRMKNNDIGLFYIIRKEGNDIRHYLRRSADEGLTWSAPKLCIPPEGYYVVNNDRVVRLSDGKIIIPAAFHRNGLSHEKGVRFDSRGEVIFFISEDDGDTWREADGKCLLPLNNYSSSGLQEPGLIELNNGVLWAWARTDMCYQYEMFSFDCGESWTAPQPSRFTSPCSPLSMKRIPGTSRLLAVWNPIPEYNGREAVSTAAWTGGRTPLVAAISEDDGRTWGKLNIIEDEPDHGYCYTAIHFKDNHVLLAYCAGGPEDGSCLTRLRIKKISLNEFAG